MQHSALEEEDKFLKLFNTMNRVEGRKEGELVRWGPLMSNDPVSQYNGNDWQLCLYNNTRIAEPSAVLNKISPIECVLFLTPVFRFIS